MGDNNVFLFSVEMDVNDFVNPNGSLEFDLKVNGADWMTTSEMEEFQKLTADAGTIVRNALIRKLNETSKDEYDEYDDYDDDYEDEWEE